MVAEFPVDTFRVDGTPSAIRSSALQWSTFGVEASAAAGQIRSLDTSLFIGPEGDTYRDGLTTNLPPHLDTTGQAYSKVAGALNGFASTLTTLQSRIAPLAVQAPGLWQAVQTAHGRVSSAQVADQSHARAQEQATDASQPGQKLPPDTYRSDSAGASLALSNAQQAWDDCLHAAQQIKTDLTAAVTACCDTIRDAAGTRFKKNPHGLGTLTSGFKHFVNDHAAGLTNLSGILKTISAVAGLLSFVPVIGEIAAPIALATGAVALAIDASIKYATGQGSWKTIAIDAGLMALPGIGKLPQAGLENAAGLARFAKGAKTADTIAARTGTPTVQATSRVDRTGSALKSDPLHRSVSWVVDDSDVLRFAIRGGDGLHRQLYQLPGEVNGKPGVFEWIVEDGASGQVLTHQRFISGGHITGNPNQRP